MTGEELRFTYGRESRNRERICSNCMATLRACPSPALLTTMKFGLRASTYLPRAAAATTIASRRDASAARGTISFRICVMVGLVDVSLNSTSIPYSIRGTQSCSCPKSPAEPLFSARIAATHSTQTRHRRCALFSLCQPWLMKISISAAMKHRFTGKLNREFESTPAAIQFWLLSCRRNERIIDCLAIPPTV